MLHSPAETVATEVDNICLEKGVVHTDKKDSHSHQSLFLVDGGFDGGFDGSHNRRQAEVEEQNRENERARGEQAIVERRRQRRIRVGALFNKQNQTLEAARRSSERRCGATTTISHNGGHPTSAIKRAYRTLAAAAQCLATFASGPGLHTTPHRSDTQAHFHHRARYQSLFALRWIPLPSRHVLALHRLYRFNMWSGQAIKPVVLGLL